MENIAVVTGASSGIGAEFARQLHQDGLNVILVARRRENLQALEASLNAKRAESASFLEVDLCAPGTPEFKKLEVLLQESPVEVFVSNAGFGSFGEFDELPLAKELDMITLNVASSTRLLHAAVGGMKQRRRGQIAIVSSIAGTQPLPYMATYSATKAFNLTQAVALHSELKSYGISVLAVCPGPVATEFGGIARMPGTVAGGRRDSVEAVVAEALRALRRGAVTVVPCMRAKLLWFASSLLPRAVSASVIARMFRPVLAESKRIK